MTSAMVRLGVFTPPQRKEKLISSGPPYSVQYQLAAGNAIENCSLPTSVGILKHGQHLLDEINIEFHR